MLRECCILGGKKNTTCYSSLGEALTHLQRCSQKFWAPWQSDILFALNFKYYILQDPCKMLGPESARASMSFSQPVLHVIAGDPQ